MVTLESFLRPIDVSKASRISPPLLTLVKFAFIANFILNKSVGVFVGANVGWSVGNPVGYEVVGRAVG
jgi:hypothetical protein